MFETFGIPLLLSNYEIGFCHSERSEESLEANNQEIFRFAQACTEQGEVMTKVKESVS
jgi:hypothetical protein